tara:strand:+ start:5867 stop:7396 length:1530 start_codon:yes stop_codon:yes gene_type:complete
MDLVDRFAAAFEGSDKAHGQTTVGAKRRNGKTEAKSLIVKEPLTKELIAQHLNGHKGVGSIPITDQNVCKFGVLDIDKYPIDHSQIQKKCDKLGIPFVVCRSKSGGAHLFLFMKDWVRAVDMRDYLTEFSAVLGYSGCEVFPKQDQILAERGDVGNFINLPYFDSENTLRYAVNAKGAELSLEQFLNLVEKRKASLDDLSKLKFESKEEEFDSLIPCIKNLVLMGIPQGMRNNAMFHTGVYLNKKYPDNWKKKLEEWNQKICKPPLPADEVVQLQKSIEKDKYGYKCKEEPMASHCNRDLCTTMEHGVGGASAIPSMGGLTILKSEPRLYFLDVNGKRLELSTEQLQMPIQFQRACMEQIDFMPPTMKPADWQRLVNNLMSNATTIEASPELTTTGQFEELLENFCTSRIRARSPEELRMGKPWTETDLTYFTMKGLQEFLRNRGFTSFNRPQIQERLKRLNSGAECNGYYKLKDDSGKWHNVRVWWVPEFDQTEISIPNKETEHDIPF